VKQSPSIDVAVRRSFASQFAAEQTSLTDETALQEDLGADSLAIVEVLVELEQTLEVELPDSDAFLAGLQTLGDVIRAFELACGE
jgi:acyl carrier protein